MGRKPKISYEEKIQAVKDYINGKANAINIAKKLDLGKRGASTIRVWVNKYKSNGPESLLPKPKNSTYTKEFKIQVVEEYLDGNSSYEELSIKYEMPSSNTVKTWVSKYNNLKELKNYNPKPEVYTKIAYRKKTTLEERKEIVKHCIENNKDYKVTASHYDVSYSQVYKWVNDYLSLGEDSLIDNRGKRKSEDKLTELEKAQREVKILKAKVKELHETENYSIKWILDIKRASYYKLLKRDIPEKELEDISLGETVNEYHDKYGGILGYRRMTTFINRNENKNYKYKRIRRIMKILDMSSSIRRVRKCCTVSNKNDEKAENILNRNFEASRPNEKWTADVCEFKIPKNDKKLYLSVFTDLYDRSIVSWQISYQNNNKLVFDTFNRAIESNPNAQPLFHSDRGFQYTSPAFKNKLEQQGIQQSMSRVACCLDNAVSEGLWGIIREEMYKLYDIHDEESLISAIENYINFYNHHRYQERFDLKSPIEVRFEALQTNTPKFCLIPINKRIEKYKDNLAMKNPTEITSIG